MSMIFPGMDPYLEKSTIWSSVHRRLVVYIADYLQTKLAPRYLASLEERVYLEGPDRSGIPDVWVREGHPGAPPLSMATTLEVDVPVLIEATELEINEPFINIIDPEADERIVAVIEVISPTNKYAGPGRDKYVQKQREVLGSTAHLVEIDLLRKGPHVLAVPEYRAREKGDYDYLVSVRKAEPSRIVFATYPRKLRERLPRIAIPLLGNDSPAVLDIQTMVAQVYDVGGYGFRLRYNEPCVPPLPPEDQLWANELIRQAKTAQVPAEGTP